MSSSSQPIDSNNTGDVAEFLISIEYCPPSKAKGVQRAFIATTTDQVLKPVEMTWDTLSDAQKAKMAFLVLNNQHVLYEDTISENKVERARDFQLALDQHTLPGKHLANFVQEGRDEVGPDTGQQCYQEYLSAHSEWWEATTIFNASLGKFHNVEPLVRCQHEDDSMVSFLISASNMILYYMLMTTIRGTDDMDAATRQYGINVQRCLRNNLTPEHIFDMVFRAGGGYPSHILENLLQPCKQTYSGKGKVGKLKLFDQLEPSTVLALVEANLRCTGPLLVDDFKTFPDFSTREKTVFHGNWNELKGPREPGFHAFLIVGVLETEDGTMGGVKFLVQDSLEGRPFIEIGWDLLKSMDIFEFTFFREGVTYEGSSLDGEFDADNIPCITYRVGRVPYTIVCASQNEGEIASLGSGDSEEPETPKIDWADMRLDIPEGADVNDLVVYS